MPRLLSKYKKIENLLFGGKIFPSSRTIDGPTFRPLFFAFLLAHCTYVPYSIPAKNDRVYETTIA